MNMTITTDTASTKVSAAATAARIWLQRVDEDHADPIRRHGQERISRRPAGLATVACTHSITTYIAPIDDKLYDRH